METFGLVDNKNSDLWNELQAVQRIEIQFEKRKEYYAFSQNDKSVIHIPDNDINPASFTHELLHIYLRTKKVFIGGGLKLSIKEKPTLSRIFSEALLEHIGNCLDHIKMLPEFLKIGYDRKEFLLDYSTNKFTDEELRNLKANFIHNGFFKKVYNASAVDFYVGKYFAIGTCPNNELDYSNALNELQKIDKDLFSILEKFLKEWIDFDYTNDDPIAGSYHLFLFDFVDELENWTKGKQIL